MKEYANDSRSSGLPSLLKASLTKAEQELRTLNRQEDNLTWAGPLTREARAYFRDEKAGAMRRLAGIRKVLDRLAR